MDTSNKAVRMGLKTAFSYLGKNPMRIFRN